MLTPDLHPCDPNSSNLWHAPVLFHAKDGTLFERSLGDVKTTDGLAEYTWVAVYKPEITLTCFYGEDTVPATLLTKNPFCPEYTFGCPQVPLGRRQGDASGSDFIDGASPTGDIGVATTNFVMPTTDFVVPTTNFVVPTTNEVVPTTNEVVPTTNNVVPTTNVVVPTTNVGQPTSDVGQPTTDVGQPTTNVGQPTTDAGQPTTNVGQPTTDAGQPTTNVGQPTTNVGQPTTDAGQPTTNVGQPTTDAGQPTTYVGIPTTNVGVPTTDPTTSPIPVVDTGTTTTTTPTTAPTTAPPDIPGPSTTTADGNAPPAVVSQPPVDTSPAGKKAICTRYLAAQSQLCSDQQKLADLRTNMCQSNSLTSDYSAIQGLLYARFYALGNNTQLDDPALKTAMATVQLAFAPTDAQLQEFCNTTDVSTVTQFCQLPTSIVNCGGVTARDLFEYQARYMTKRDNNICTNFLNKFKSLSYCPTDQDVPLQDLSFPTTDEVASVGMSAENQKVFLQSLQWVADTQQVPKSACSLYNAARAGQTVCGDTYASPCKNGVTCNSLPVSGIPIPVPKIDPNPTKGATTIGNGVVIGNSTKMAPIATPTATTKSNGLKLVPSLVALALLALPIVVAG